MGTERVVKLLQGHRVRIAKALVRQARALAPRYEQLDLLAMERSYIQLIFAVEKMLAHGDDSSLIEQTEQLAAMRRATGFQMEEFLLGSLGWLPVMRRFILEQGQSIDEAIADYDAFEAIALPFVARAASTFLEAEEEPTLPNAARPRTRSSQRIKSLRVERVERVSGSEEEEHDITYRTFPPFSSSGS